jgi:hypothetical protein
MVRLGRVRGKPFRRIRFHSMPDHVPADPDSTTSDGALVGIQRSRPKTPLFVMYTQVAARLSRPKALYILLELEPTAWVSTPL